MSFISSSYEAFQGCLPPAISDRTLAYMPQATGEMQRTIPPSVLVNITTTCSTHCITPKRSSLYPSLHRWLGGLMRPAGTHRSWYRNIAARGREGLREPTRSNLSLTMSAAVCQPAGWSNVVGGTEELVPSTAISAMVTVAMSTKNEPSFRPICSWLFA